MGDLPPPWKSFYDRALDYLNDGDLEEARWSAERALYYLEKSAEQNDHLKLTLELLQRIMGLESAQGTPDVESKSLWQHLRED